MAGNIEIPPDVLDEMIRQEKKQLQNLLRLRGKNTDGIEEFCKDFGISKQSLAIGIIFEAGGDISQVELARKLNIHERTLRKRNWRKVRTLLKS